MIKQCRSLLMTVGLLASLSTMASGVDGLITFSAGTPAKAGEVNANFTAVKTAVDDSQAQIDTLKAQVATLQAQLNNIIAINQYLSLQTVNNQPTLRVTGANLQVVNGTGDTATSNGTGNLIIGYDEVRTNGVPQCSVGIRPGGSTTPITDQNACTTAGGTWAISHKSGSHYLVVGSRNNYSRWGGAVIGFVNTSNFDYASVTGGHSNTASSSSASVCGGYNNTASGLDASVSGGYNNTASGTLASISAGTDNIASGTYASITGGSFNTASGSYTSVSGGYSNTASGSDTSLNGSHASVSGGTNNTASGRFTSISGGNTVSNSVDSGWAAGGTAGGTFRSP